MDIKRVTRSRTDKVLGGVCGGLGRYFGIDPVLIRALMLVLFFGFEKGLLLYLLAWVIIPPEPENEPFTYTFSPG